jgi:hypothetical protein
LALLTLLCLTLAPVANSQRGALTISRNLEQLLRESQVVVQGQVVTVRVEPHPQLAHLTTVVVTLRVEDTLKGQTTDSYTFRQAVIDRRDLEDRLGYRPGQHVLLTLIQPNQYGLSSPAGLEQGRFRIDAGPDGKLQAVNGRGNVGLFSELSQQMQAKGLRVPQEAQAMVSKAGAGPVPLDQLKSLIQALAAEK